MARFFNTIYTHSETHEGATDEELLARSVNEPHVFKELVRRYEEPFLRKVGMILGGKDEAHDVVQDTFMKIYLNAGRFKVQEGAKFSSWAYKILMNTSFTRYQKLKKDRALSINVEDSVLENFAGADEVEIRALTEYVVAVLSKMPRDLSRVLRMHFLEGMPQKDIAKDLGITLEAVKARVHRAKKEFKKNDSEHKPELTYVGE